MTERFPTNHERRHASHMARSLAEDAAKRLISDAQEALDDTLRGIIQLRECGVKSSFLIDTLKGLLDEAGDIVGSVDPEIRATDPNWDRLDVQDIERLLATIELNSRP